MKTPARFWLLITPVVVVMVAFMVFVTDRLARYDVEAAMLSQIPGKTLADYSLWLRFEAVSISDIGPCIRYRYYQGSQPVGAINWHFWPLRHVRHTMP